jgi:hypothetical protein
MAKPALGESKSRQPAELKKPGRRRNRLTGSAPARPEAFLLNTIACSNGKNNILEKFVKVSLVGRYLGKRGIL